jgi:hypothetical protein
MDAHARLDAVVAQLLAVVIQARELAWKGKGDQRVDVPSALDFFTGYLSKLFGHCSKVRA